MAKPQPSAASRFNEYVNHLGETLNHADRIEPLRAYLTGLLLPGDRKSIEPMAAKVDPARVSSRHQSMHHFVASAPWDSQGALAVARDYALEQIERHAPVAAWVIDDTGMPKKGSHSVGVARQYCGILGKQENCQVVVTVSLTNTTMSVPGAYRLYLPEAWAKDRKRRRKAGVPPEITFATKWEIALESIDALTAEDLPRAPVVADAGYGVVTEFREGITHRGLSYIVGISAETSLWPPGLQPLSPRRWSGRGRPPKRLRRTARHRPLSAKELAMKLPALEWKTVRWREGTRGTMQSRFAAVRVRPAHEDDQRTEPRDIEWFLVEWPRGEKEPTKYWLSTVPQQSSLDDLVRLGKIRWRIERDYEEMKSELGLDHYEGRNWLGFHHHGVLCIAAYAFLAAERARLSPPEPLAFLKPARIPKGFRPRGASVAS
ncbi:MAG TPA: IS701 family transposase [Candidatus Paceibacterota bacterium]|nr:IS701 family transposase [Candidatus Paceibacterota bacterium]